MKRVMSRVVIAAAVALICGTSALRAQAAKVDVTGKWAFSVETSAGTGTPTMTFKQDGEKITGHYSGQLGEADLSGTVQEQEISFSFSVDAQGTRLDITSSGTIAGKDSMKGHVVITGLGEGSWTAKRQ